MKSLRPITYLHTQYCFESLRELTFPFPPENLLRTSSTSCLSSLLHLTPFLIPLRLSTTLLTLPFPIQSTPLLGHTLKLQEALPRHLRQGKPISATGLQAIAFPKHAHGVTAGQRAAGRRLEVGDGGGEDVVAGAWGVDGEGGVGTRWVCKRGWIPD